jgi:DNA (cytosine-5)-methyltransferase 1
MFSGIRAPEVAMPGVKWIWSAEIEAFPNSVSAAHFPAVPNLGDVTAPDFIERAAAYGPLDLLVAGSPCQSFSFAGLRRSLADDRGNLTLRLVEVVDAINPGFLLWENVPGVLNTKDNALGCFLGGLVGADAPLVPARGQRWTDAGMVIGPKRNAAWRILDAQYFFLAQRRERVFVVSGRAGDTRCAQILFEPESVRRNYPPSRQKGQEVTGTIGARATGGGGLGTDFEIGGGLQPLQL